MPLYKIVVRIPFDSGLPEDVAVNTWYFQADDDAAALVAGAALEDFYLDVDQFFSSVVDASADAATVTAYDMADDQPRVPVYADGFTLTDASGTPLPNELAVCLSYQGTRVSGLPQARRRGRVYLGPLDTGTLTAAGIVNSTCYNGIRDAAQDLLDASDAASSWNWMQYSPTTQDAIAVVDGWVDNEFDIQRRRGRRPTVRATFS